MSDWNPIETAPRDGTVVAITAFDDGDQLETWYMQWDEELTNEMFAPGTVGMWVTPSGQYTWREGDGGPTHWRPLRTEH